MSDQIPALYSTSQVCKMLSISPASLFRLIKAGKISHLKIGTSLRFRREDIQNFINALSKEQEKN